MANSLCVNNNLLAPSMCTNNNLLSLRQKMEFSEDIEALSLCANKYIAVPKLSTCRAHENTLWKKNMLVNSEAQ
jgi:hypothetical protein